MAVQATTETVTRVTKEGRKLTYALTVIQQPERARACGSGAKSSADRRPVDPPPVVELKIFEGDTKNDITFSYNANFFLFATLESARPIIHGRVQAASQQIPVLTGMPVSGMAYLDRPEEAGYFIFPDLSVRHEGKYRLSFNLYEETKETKDSDIEQVGEPQPKATAAASTPNGSFDWRLEVKSNAFTVFSAKKFPGLAESTMLSRTVAEQGCRVRIRRDVRMRRRDGKSGENYDDEDQAYARARRTATPDSNHESYIRERSMSSSPYAPDQRRQSGGEYSQQPYSSSYAQSPVTPQSGTTGYLSFGGSTQPYQAPQFAPLAPPHQPLQSQQVYQQAQPTYSQQPTISYRPASTATNYTFSERTPFSHQYGAQRENFEPEYRRPSVTYPPPPASSGQYTSAEQNYPRNTPLPSYPQYQTRPRSPLSQGVDLAPLKMPMEPKLDNISTSADILSGSSRMAPALPSPSYTERPSSFSLYNTPGPAPAAPESVRSAKRSFDTVFNSSSLTQPLHNGMRPTSSHHIQGPSAGLEDEDDAAAMEALKMSYKRADGSQHHRELPALQ